MKLDKDDFLFTSLMGVDWYMHEEDGEVTIACSSDVSDQLDTAKEMASHNSGWSEDKTFRRVGIIPAVIQMKWLNEEGWWWEDPNAANKLKAKMNDPEYRYLRTAEWQF